MKIFIKELHVKVSIDQLKKLRAQNPPVPMLSRLDEGEEENQVALPQPQPPESQVALTQPSEGFFELLGRL